MALMGSQVVWATSVVAQAASALQLTVERALVDVPVVDDHLDVRERRAPLGHHAAQLPVPDLERDPNWQRAAVHRAQHHEDVAHVALERHRDVLRVRPAADDEIARRATEEARLDRLKRVRLPAGVREAGVTAWGTLGHATGDGKRGEEVQRVGGVRDSDLALQSHPTYMKAGGTAIELVGPASAVCTTPPVWRCTNWKRTRGGSAREAAQ